MTRRRAALGAALVLSAFTVAAGCAKMEASMEERFKPLGVGDPAPAYAARVLDGGAIDSARVGAGAGTQPLTLVNVWATWCIPCQEEFPDLQAIHHDYAPRGLRVLAISVDAGSDDEVRAFVKDKGATFEIARDESGRIRQLYQSVGVPETYLLSPEGKVLWRQPGALPKGAGTARAAIDAAFAGAQPPRVTTEGAR